MFGKGPKRGFGAFGVKTPVHEVMTRHIWTGGGFSGAVRDTMITNHNRRLKEPLPKPPPNKPRRPF